ncbi:MAG: IS110 family transposase [Desulfomonilia bacterium]
MSRGYSNAVLSVVHEHCCGLDIHKDKVSAAVITTHGDGTVEEVISEFGTFTEDLYRLKEWVFAHGCDVVAMESTGVYWRPVHNVLEEELPGDPCECQAREAPSWQEDRRI